MAREPEGLCQCLESLGSLLILPAMGETDENAIFIDEMLYFRFAGPPSMLRPPWRRRG